MRPIKDQLVGLDPRFNYRGLNQTRIETFSDAVFAFSLTLVVLSSSVPETVTELRDSFRNIIPFFACSILIVLFWFQHYIFFLRYGLQDIKTVVINTILLFVLLIYVYPLKFLMTFLFELCVSGFTGDFQRVQLMMDSEGGGWYLMLSYGGGASIIFLLLAWLYHHAYSRRAVLGLNRYEEFLTKVSILSNILMSLLPTISATLVLAGVDFRVAGFIYMLYPLIMIPFGVIVRKRSKKNFPLGIEK